MSQLKFIAGAKEEIPAKYLDQLFALMLVNYKEILKSDLPEVEFYKKRWTLGTSSDQEQIFVLVLNQEDKVSESFSCPFCHGESKNIRIFNIQINGIGEYLNG